MDKGNRPVGRQKKVGSGTDNVQKRGEGLSDKVDGPVGNKDGYADIFDGISNQQAPSPTDSGHNQFPPGASIPSGRAGLSKSGSSKSIIIFLIIAVAIYFLYSYYSNKKKDQPNSTNTNISNTQSGSSNTNAHHDTGAYAVNASVSNQARDKYTAMKGNGEDTVTVMVYICGSDLETETGSATSDIQEILYADISEKVNVVIETGGAKQWQNKVINSKTNQRYRLTSEGLELLEGDLGKRSMVNPSTLTDFIQYSKNKFPADRYFLIMWDHGAGSMTGYGYDQYFFQDSMTLDEIDTALKNSRCQFDFIGFDACLMATYETALVLEPYADYMIASEEAEPDIGWYYTGWINALSKDTSIPTIELGKILIDDYIKDVKTKIPDNQATLSLVDLAELKGTAVDKFASFATSTKSLIKKEFKTVSDARSQSKEFAASQRINQIDLIHFAKNIGTTEANIFAKTLQECIKYNRSTSNVANAYGLSIFFPYSKPPSMVSPILETYEEIGVDENYCDCIRSFANIETGGQVVASGNDNLLESLLGGLTNQSGNTSPGINIDLGQLLNQFLHSGNLGSILGTPGETPDWLDADQMQSAIPYYQKNKFDASALKIIEKDGQKVISLSEDQWKLVHYMEMNVFIDDGKGFIDLGLDNVYDYNDDGDLVMEYDGTWLSLNGQIVSYYFISEDRYGDTFSIKGRIPAMLNNQLVDIILVFNNSYPDGFVLGAQKKYNKGKETETYPKGFIEIKSGDKIDYLCDYYTYEGKYTDTYYLGNQYTATGKWKIENISVGNKKYLMTYRFTDIFNNQYWTQTVSE